MSRHPIADRSTMASRPPRLRLRLRLRLREEGQAALALVLGIVVLLATGGGILATSAIQHDPLVQSDALQHYAYRALEAGINSYLNTINANPTLVNCSTTSTSSTCTSQKYDTWIQVPKSTTATGAVPEYYLWTNPQLCFSKTQIKNTTCTTKPTSGNLEYLQELVVGAAGPPGHFQYQRAVANFAPENGFLTHLWWSKYESAPNSKTTTNTTICSYDYPSYGGPGGTCTPVYFGPGDVIDGPLFTDDSIYVADHPTFGTAHGTHPTAIDTVDPSCWVVTSPGSTYGSYTKGCQTSPTSRATYTTANSHFGLPPEIPPTTDTTLETLAARGGCLYTGPTTISFVATTAHKTGYMNVYSPETPKGAPTTPTHDNDNLSTNHNICLGNDIRIPDGTPAAPTGKGNGVIYVKTNTNTSACSSQLDNPYDAYLSKEVKVTVVKKEKVTVTVVVYVTVTVTQWTWTWQANKWVVEKVKKRERTTQKEQVTETVTVQVTELQTVVTSTRAQIVTNGGGGSYDHTDTVQNPGAKKYANCAGDAFVHDANSGAGTKVPGFAGQLTIGTQENVVVTGTVKYADCQATFNSSYVATLTNSKEHACNYNSGAGAVNDALGLIANNDVVVNRPVCPGYGYSNAYCTSTKGLLKRCSTQLASGQIPSTATHTWESALCNPARPTLTIDAAVLALKRSFTVENYTRGGATGRLVVYGAMAQYWRGAVGNFTPGGSTIQNGFSKYYTFDSRLPYVSIPSYLTPGTASWGIVSSSVVLSNSCSAWPKPYPHGYPFVKTGVASSSSTFWTTPANKAKSNAPTGAACT